MVVVVFLVVHEACNSLRDENRGFPGVVVSVGVRVVI